MGAIIDSKKKKFKEKGISRGPEVENGTAEETFTDYTPLRIYKKKDRKLNISESTPTKTHKT